MSKFGFGQAAFPLALLALGSAPLSFATAHEDHKMNCSEPSINAMNADIQAMDSGEAKATATAEMKKAEEMLARKDLEACEAHMHSAMVAMEK